MDRRHRRGKVVLGLGLAMLVGLAEIALYRWTVRPPALDGAQEGATGRTTAPAAPASLASLLQAPDPPGVGLLPAPTCRVVGYLERATAGEGIIWGTLTNVGSVTTTLDGVELGWTGGDATLAEILVLRWPGEAPTTLFSGTANSPFYATNDAGWQIAPGGSAQLGLRFAWGNPDAPWLLQATVVHLRNGCRAVLRPRIDGPTCPVRITDRPRVPSSARNRVEVTVENTGQTSDSLTALEVAWPVATNGRLRKVTVDGTVIIDLKDGYRASPATLPLARMREDGIGIEPGKPTSIGLEFERNAAQDGYSFQGATRNGCSISTTTGLAAWDCGVGSGEVSIDGDVARYKLTNPRDIDRAITDVTLFWPTSANGPLVSVSVDGQPLWRGEQHESPVSVSLAAPVRLPAGGSLELAFRFRPPSAAGSGPQLSAGAYTLVVALDGGCQSAFTNRAAVGECDLSAGELVSLVEPTSHNMQVDIFNNGDDVRLASLHLVWPAGNGGIRGIRWGGQDLLGGAALVHATEGVTFTVPSGLGSPLAQGSRTALAVDFTQAPMPSGYTFALHFVNRRGEPCQTVLVTRHAAPDKGTTNACAAKLIGPRFGADRTQFVFDLRNDRSLADALVGLDINVAQFEAISPLSTIEIERAGGETQTLWTNLPLRRPPYPVRLADPYLLEASETVTLRLQFAATFLPTGRAEEVVTVRADLGDGCEVWNVPLGVDPPASTLLTGVIAQLPSPLLSCCWLIRRWDNDVANREIKVDVDASTVLDPASLTPRDGDPVFVTGITRADGSFYAQRIEFQQRGAQLKVAGTITKLGPDSAARPGLPEWFIVEGRLVSLTDATTVNGPLTVGARVFVTGTPNGGTVLAGTIDVSGAAVRELISRKTVEGILVRIVDQGAERYWTIGSTTVHITPATQFYDANNALVPNPPAVRRGAPMRAEGSIETGAPNGGTAMVRADSVWLLPHHAEMRVTGKILQLPPAGLIGEWKVEADGAGTMTFFVRTMAVVDTRAAPAQAGNRLSAVLQQATDGSWVALKLRTDGDGP